MVINGTTYEQPALKELIGSWAGAEEKSLACRHADQLIWIMCDAHDAMTTTMTRMQTWFMRPKRPDSFELEPMLASITDTYLCDNAGERTSMCHFKLKLNAVETECSVRVMHKFLTKNADYRDGLKLAKLDGGEDWHHKDWHRPDDFPGQIPPWQSLPSAPSSALSSMDVAAGSATDAIVPDFHFDLAKVPDGLCAAHLVYSKRRHEQAWRELATLYNDGTVPYVPNDREFTEKYGERGFSAGAYDVTHVQYNHKKHVWAIARGGISIGRSGPKKLKDLTWKAVQPEYLAQDAGVCPRWMLGSISIDKAANDQLKEATEKDRIGYAPLKNSYYYALPVRVLEKKITAETHPDGSPERKGYFSFESHFSAAPASVVSTKRGATTVRHRRQRQHQ